MSKYHYGLRLDGKRSSVTDSGPATNGGTTNYSYDDQGKLTGEAGPYATIAYGYDNVGNRLTRTVTNAATGNGTTLVNGVTNMTYDLNDRIATVNGSVTHTYDLDGNETTVNGQTAGYDFENHLVSLATAANGTVLASYVYDADGNRVSTYVSTNTPTTTSYVVDTSLPYASAVEEYSGTATVPSARYDYGDDLVRMDRGGIYYYIYDGLGSTRQLVNTSGGVTDSYGYSAFGEMASRTSTQTLPTVNPFLFNAQQFDGASGDYYLRARYYDQSNGRFISQDPYSGNNDDPISLHRYLYASGDPVSRIDPSGKSDLCQVLTGIGITATLAGIVGAGISTAREALFNPKHTNSSLLRAAATGYVSGFAIGGLLAIPGVAAYLLPALVFQGAQDVSTEWNQGKRGEAVFDAALLLIGLKLANTGCFVNGTLVQMGDGSVKNISHIKVGDIVFSRNIKTGRTERKLVKRVFVHHVSEVICISLTNTRTGKIVEQVTSTPNHPFYVHGRGFVQAAQLGIGNVIVTRAGPSLRVAYITEQQQAMGYIVYNFEVADDHTYFVGKINSGLWVHNADCRADVFGKALSDAGVDSSAQPVASWIKGPVPGQIQEHNLYILQSQGDYIQSSNPTTWGRYYAFKVGNGYKIIGEHFYDGGLSIDQGAQSSRVLGEGGFNLE